MGKNTKAVILAAGVGSRLGNPFPKPLTPLSDGSSIMERQLGFLNELLSPDDVCIVVGFKKETIMERFPEPAFVYNPFFADTNTARSLVLALRKMVGYDVIWMNGDVVFDGEVLGRIAGFDGSCMAVNTASVGEEEVKYRTAADGDGSIIEVSKTVSEPMGESVGVNKVTASDLPLFIEMLSRCSDDDYFEKGLELAIGRGLKIYPVDVSDLLCIEVDFAEDLEKANRKLSGDQKD